MMPSCRIFLVCILLITLYESVDSKLSRHTGAYLCKSWKSCPLQIPLKKCSKHMSVRLAQICDGKPQCPCGDDEENCDPICPSQFRCRNKTCIPASKVCDGTPDCQDNEDEVMCPKPEPLCPGMFVCLNGTCIPAQKTCDGNPDCGEQEDESMCPPPAPVCPGMFACLNGTCIPAEMTCDGNPDCGELEDERMCPPPESLCPGMFACLNRTCIPANKACDKIPDCEQSEDEVNCTAEPLCRTCAYEEECYSPLPYPVPDNLFLSTTTLPVPSPGGIVAAFAYCNTLCTLNMACKSTWQTFMPGSPNMVECRLSSLPVDEIATAVTSSSVDPCALPASNTFTQVECQDHPAP